MSILKRYFLICLVMIVSVLMIAASPMQAPSGDVLVFVQLAIAAFTALIGWPALLSTIVSVLIYFGKLSTAAADVFIFWANVLVFGAILILALLGKIDLVNQVDSTFGNLAQLVTYILIILGVPMGFERSKRTTERFVNTSFFQARVLK